MIIAQESIQDFLGLMTHLDEQNMPLGSALVCQNVAQYFPLKIQRIPGLTVGNTITDSEDGMPHSWGVRIDGGTEQIMVVADKGSSSTATIYNITSGAALTGGTALTNDRSGLLAGVWTSTYFLRRRYVANGLQAIQVIDSASAKSAITGTPTPPVGSLVKSYLGRLYVAGVDSPNDDKVFYSDSLTTNFQATSFLNIDEVPGPVLGMAINSMVTGGDFSVRGELIFAKKTGLVKLLGDPTSDTAVKEVVSSVIGCDAVHTFANTPIGLLFLGVRSGVYSVYFLPLGEASEPQDVGLPLSDVLNDSTAALTNVQLSSAVYHDGMYKLFVNLGGVKTELWADVNGYIRDQKIRWYGPHLRSAGQAPVVSEAGVLNVFEVISGAGKALVENSSKNSGFTDANGSVMGAELDLTLNVPPRSVDKSYDLFDVYFARESNVTDNEAEAHIFIEGIEVTTPQTLNLYGPNSLTGVDVHVPIIGFNGASLFSRYPVRVQLIHTLNKRFDISSMDVRYLHDEQATHKSGAGR